YGGPAREAAHRASLPHPGQSGRRRGRVRLSLFRRREGAPARKLGWHVFCPPRVEEAKRDDAAVVDPVGAAAFRRWLGLQPVGLRELVASRPAAPGPDRPAPYGKSPLEDPAL